MLRNRSLRIKLVKDEPTTDPTMVDAIRIMTPEEIEQTSRKLMKQAAITVGAVIVTRIVVTVAAEVIANTIEYHVSKKL